MRPLSNDLREFIRLLESHGVEYVVVGAWSLAFHGRPRYTGDLDIFVRPDPGNAERMMRVLMDFGFGSAGVEREDFLKTDFVIQLGMAPNRIDLLTGISGVSFEQAWQQRERGAVGGATMNLLSRQLLIQNKRASNRDKDLGDLRLLEETKPPPPPKGGRT